MKNKTKTNEIMKVMLVCLLSIGVLCAVYLGFNHLIFASALNDTTPLPTLTITTPQISEYPETEAGLETGTEEKQEAFVAPALTLIESPHQHYHPIPASALGMEEAAQLGAHYIHDVFGTNVGGLYVEMMFASHASHTSTRWIGLVFAENPSNQTPFYGRRIDGVEGIENETYTARPIRLSVPMYMFTINGITGERLDISFHCQPRIAHRQVGDNIFDMRTSLLESGWFDMNLDEQIAFAGISDKALEAYTQIASNLAQAQFNLSGVADVKLSELGASGMIDNVVDLVALNFIATDSTGREALIFIPSADAGFNMINISTSHNDFIPGFIFEDDGLGLG